MAGDRCSIPVGVLSKCDNDILYKLLHQLVDGICERRCVRYQDYMKTWDLQDWWDVSDTCQSFIKQAIKHGWTKDKIENSVSELSKDQKQILTEVILSRSDDLHEHLRSKTTQISNASLQDFDWQMKLAMSSDKLATVQEPLLVVDLNIRESEKKKAVSLEMNKLELEKMITSLEAANKVVQQLKS